ncbi:hypothetical protein Ptc2401_01265 [Prosthecochloris sp. CIB 2401]|nr:hypothetical protein Ptc2401_01265 [Prosthecochloris sp. CIB 2401]
MTLPGTSFFAFKHETLDLLVQTIVPSPDYRQYARQPTILSGGTQNRGATKLHRSGPSKQIDTSQHEDLRCECTIFFDLM